MSSLTKYPGSPIYQQLEIPITVDTSAAEIGFIRTLVDAHIARVRAGAMNKKGREGLLQLLNNLEDIKHLLKE